MDSRRKVFLYDISLAIALAVAGACYLVFPSAYDFVPDKYRLILHATFFGALGGIVISLKGVYDHPIGQAPAWNDAYNLWHYGRPVSGGIVGFMTLLLLIAINPGAPPARPVVYAAAFILGTQERRFFNFLYEVARLILQVPQEQNAGVLSIAEIQPRQGHQNDVIVVCGKCFHPGATLSLGTNQVQNLRISSDGTALAGNVPAPPVPPGPVDVVVQNTDGSRAVLTNGFTFQP